MKRSIALRPALIGALIVCAALPTCLSAREWTEGLDLRIGDAATPMPYRLYFPKDYSDDRDWPLLIFLHGSGESGTNNVTHVAPAWFDKLLELTYESYPAILVAPQAHPDESWGPYYDHEHLADLLPQLLQQYAVDSRRIYLTGLSMGGFGAMTYLQEYHAFGLGDIRFAAVAPFAGAWFVDDPAVRDIIAKTPIWMAHNTSDPIVNISVSQDTFRFLSGLEANEPFPFVTSPRGIPGRTAEIDGIRYTEILSSSHDSWSPFWGSRIFFNWMFAQSLPVPEPSSATLALTLCLAMCARPRSRRRRLELGRFLKG